MMCNAFRQFHWIIHAAEAVRGLSPFAIARHWVLKSAPSRPQPPLPPPGKIRQFKKLSRNRKKHDTPIKINFIRQIFKTNPPSLLHLIPKGENHFSLRWLRTYHERRMASVGILEHESLLNTLRRDRKKENWRRISSGIPLRINSRRAAHKFWQLLERNNSPSRLEGWRRNEHPNRCH